VFAWLRQLRASGTRVVLITNSKQDYAACLLQHMFGWKWQDAFDLVITFARKPSFFTENPAERGFEIQHEAGGAWKEEALLPRGGLANKVVVGGTYQGLCQYLAGLPESPGKAGACFFGDHLWGDVGATRLHTDWEPVAVVEELAYRGPAREGEEPVGPCRTPQWGDFLTEGEGGAPTHWGTFIEKVTPWVVPSVEPGHGGPGGVGRVNQPQKWLAHAPPPTHTRSRALPSVRNDSRQRSRRRHGGHALRHSAFAVFFVTFAAADSFAGVHISFLHRLPGIILPMILFDMEPKNRCLPASVPKVYNMHA